MNKIWDLRKQFNQIKNKFKIFKITKKQIFGSCSKYCINKFNKFYI